MRTPPCAAELIIHWTEFHEASEMKIIRWNKLQDVCLSHTPLTNHMSDSLCSSHFPGTLKCDLTFGINSFKTLSMMFHNTKAHSLTFTDDHTGGPTMENWEMTRKHNIFTSFGAAGESPLKGPSLRTISRGATVELTTTSFCTVEQTVESCTH